MRKLPEINCDLGEGMADECQIYPLIDSASIACGGHYGDEDSMNESLSLAKQHCKKVGAHPSYPDKQHFGRKTIKISAKDLTKSILVQIVKFEQLAEKKGMQMDHIKFHGALYNDAAAHSEVADLLTDFIADHFHNTPILAPPHSQLEKHLNQKGLNCRTEVFGDRGYLDNYLLMPRNIFGSHMTTEPEISSHLENLLKNGYLLSHQGKKLKVAAETICFHGDNPGIGDFLPTIRKKYWK
ncbi:LamB/YcsF family protein [Algoriphagus halophytocola]|uniref:LamB/YcsF family protein n=1 Tax=Algoriphagus halophytocola TaxID=2991499 RepID=A0ABY6MH58_9BACT|nr:MULTISPECIES: LamB/YcsF family protein [unclassified Algoriphagus]UZD23127.1 LamB/YcsF family protein [Algoriphagus sp. TR-M5]WBL44419.1 LamB/YcsF family protein [Algoriphagus sp. TR-M9]